MVTSTRRASALVATACGLALGLSACGGDDGDRASTASAQTSRSAETSASPTPTGSASASPDRPGATASAGQGTPEKRQRTRVPDQVLRSYVPVKRNGKAPRPSISAAPQPFDAPVRWEDGLRLSVTDIAQGTVTGQGPGVIDGAPKTAVSLRMTNPGDRAVSLSQVVVTAVYGSDPQRRASPVYDARSRDFSGPLRPGDSATARYVFSVPRSELDDVTMFVDVDGRHTAARFTGAVTG